jgi:hypothetical protein
MVIIIWNCCFLESWNKEPFVRNYIIPPFYWSVCLLIFLYLVWYIFFQREMKFYLHIWKVQMWTISHNWENSIKYSWSFSALLYWIVNMILHSYIYLSSNFLSFGEINFFLFYRTTWNLSCGDPARVQILYKRAIAEFPIASQLWLDYTRYLDKTLKVFLFISHYIFSVLRATICWPSNYIFLFPLRLAEL